jgi:hypothetical protein
MSSPEILEHNAYKRHKYDLEIGVHKKNEDSRDQRILHWWDSFSKGIIGISTIGASICFSVIFSDLPDPVAIRQVHDTAFSKKIHFDRETVRKFLSLSWLMFVLALGFAIIAQLKLRKSTSWGSGLKALEITLNCLVLAAFMFLSLAVAAFVPEVGIAGVAFLSFFAFTVICMWLGAI